MTDTAKFHDMGGRPNGDPIDQGEHVLMDWERRIDSIPRGVLDIKGHFGVDELRRAIEALPPERYEALSYYERWTEAIRSSPVWRDKDHRGPARRKRCPHLRRT